VDKKAVNLSKGVVTAAARSLRWREHTLKAPMAGLFTIFGLLYHFDKSRYTE